MCKFSAPKYVWRSGSAQTHWGRLSAPPDHLAAMDAVLVLLLRGGTEGKGGVGGRRGEIRGEEKGKKGGRGREGRDRREGKERMWLP